MFLYLLGVLLCFREHSIAISSNIWGMFHQVRLLPKDKPLHRFLWQDPKDRGNTQYLHLANSSVWHHIKPLLCYFCASEHVFSCSVIGEEVRVSIERSFSVDNCLQSLGSMDDALHQWASNAPEINHLTKDAKVQEQSELWLH